MITYNDKIIEEVKELSKGALLVIEGSRFYGEDVPPYIVVLKSHNGDLIAYVYHLVLLNGKEPSLSFAYEITKYGHNDIMNPEE